MKRAIKSIFSLFLISLLVCLVGCSHSSDIDNYLNEAEPIVNEAVKAAREHNVEKINETSIALRKLEVKYAGKGVKVENMNDRQKERFQRMMEKLYFESLGIPNPYQTIE